MAISIAWGDSYDGFDSGGNTTNTGIDTTGYTHVVAFASNDATSSVITLSDSVSSTGWTYLTQTTQSGITARMGYAKLASTGSGYTVTAIHTGGSPTYRTVGFWLIDADSGEIELDDDALASAASGNPASAGTLACSGASVVSVLNVQIEGASTGNTQGTDWTEDFDNSENFGLRVIAAHRGPETTTSIPASYTLANTGIPWIAMAAAFREGTAAGGLRRKGSLGLLGVGR